MVPPGLNPCLGQRTLLIRPASDKVDPAYLTYLLVGPEVQGTIHSLTNGSTVAHLNMKDVRALPLPHLPALVEQRRIASILSAYDDLIENCQRRIRILEDMARGLYREWFVHFRFPGADALPRVDSPLGPIPQGWATVDLAAVCAAGNGIQTGPFGSQLHEADYSPEGVPVVMPKDLIGYRIREDSIARIPEATADGLKRHRMSPGDIVYGRRGDIGRRAFVAP